MTAAKSEDLLLFGTTGGPGAKNAGQPASQTSSGLMQKFVSMGVAQAPNRRSEKC